MSMKPRANLAALSAVACALMLGTAGAAEKNGLSPLMQGKSGTVGEILEVLATAGRGAGYRSGEHWPVRRGHGPGARQRGHARSGEDPHPPGHRTPCSPITQGCRAAARGRQPSPV